jgi:hypothetical protein
MVRDSEDAAQAGGMIDHSGFGSWVLAWARAEGAEQLAADLPLGGGRPEAQSLEPKIEFARPISQPSTESTRP